MPKFSGTTWFGIASTLAGWGLDKLNVGPLIPLGAILIGVGCFCVGVWKWLDEFQHVTARRRVREKLRLRVGVLAMMVTTVFLAAGNYYQYQHKPRLIPSTSEDFAEINKLWSNDYPLIPVNKQKFVNREVVLDGRIFTDCEFDNVTFKYNGTAPVRMNRADINGFINFASDNPALEGLIRALYALGYFRNLRVNGPGADSMGPPPTVLPPRPRP